MNFILKNKIASYAYIHIHMRTNPAFNVEHSLFCLTQYPFLGDFR